MKIQMTDYRSHAIKVANIPQGKRILLITKRRMIPILVAALFTGCIVALLQGSYKILALPSALYLLIALFKKYGLLFAGYENFLVYNNQEEDYNIIYFSEIDSWTYEKTSLSRVVQIELKSGEVLTINRGVNALVHNYLKKCLSDKEKH